MYYVELPCQAGKHLESKLINENDGYDDNDSIC
jgi:hypothetical protein